MAKWSGLVGFAENVEIEPGLSEERIITHKYRGDFLPRDGITTEAIMLILIPHYQM